MSRERSGATLGGQPSREPPFRFFSPMAAAQIGRAPLDRRRPAARRPGRRASPSPAGAGPESVQASPHRFDAYGRPVTVDKAHWVFARDRLEWAQRSHPTGGGHAPDADRAGPPDDLHRGRAGAAAPGRGWKLNHPEALAIICDEMHEAARGGASYEEVMRRGQSASTADDVLDGVPELIGTVKIECLFGDGMRVLHVEQPIGPGAERRRGSAMKPGEMLLRRGADHPQRRTAHRRDRGREHLGPHHLRQLALPLLRGEPAAGLRSRAGLGHAPRRPGRRLRALAARRAQARPAGRLRRPRRRARLQPPDRGGGQPRTARRGPRARRAARLRPPPREARHGA